MHRSTALVILGLCVASSVAAAQVLTVDTLEDVVDFGGSRRVADLPGPDGRVSFREALTAANNTPGPQTIGFAIPQNEWWLVDNMALLKLENGAFVVTDDETTFDFASQADFTGDTNPDGREVGIYGLEANGWGTPAIIVNADNCVFRGLGTVWQRGAAVSIWHGNHNRVVGCVTTEIEIDPYPNHCAFNVIGGTDPEDGNTLEQVNLLCGADDNTVIGNHLRTVFVGASPYCDTASRNRIGGPTPEERNVINGFGSYGEEGFPGGQGIHISWATDTLIEGNYIGVEDDGMSRHPQIGPAGIDVEDSWNTTIRANLISGIWVQGVNHYAGQLFGDAILVTAINNYNTGTLIQGNLIGTDATGENPILTLNGVTVAPFIARYTARDTVIGGDGPGEANTIAFNQRRGVSVHTLVKDVLITANSIFGNGELGIDLGTNAGYDGVSQNDPGDGDTQGGNELQNFPVLDAADTTGSSVGVTGVLNSHAGTTYRVEFFANTVCDPSGYGQGERFLGSVEVTTDGAGDAPFDVDLSASVPAGMFLTATATDLAIGATSEFAACVEIEAAGCDADFDGNGSVNTLDVLAFLNAWNAGDPRADFNGDGSVNTLDVLAFLNAWSAGC